MNFNLYEISKAISEISQMVDEDGVLLPEAIEALDQLEMTQTEKFMNLGGLLKNLGANSKALKEEAKRLTMKAKIIENKEYKIKEWIKFVLESKNGNMPIKAGIFTFKLRAFPSVIIDPEVEFDDKYVIIKREVSKTLIKADLKAGIEVEGASIQKSNSVIIS